MHGTEKVPNVGAKVCTICKKKFLTVWNLKSHLVLCNREIKISKKRKPTPEVESKVLQKEPCMKPKEITEFKCHVCANSFKTESEKNNHIQSNHNTQIRTCSKCDLKFNEMTMVEWLTVRSLHEINDCLVRKDPSVLVNTLKCTFCDFKSNKEGIIEKHMKGNHEELSKTPPFKKRKK